jgi:hypothetical protein
MNKLKVFIETLALLSFVACGSSGSDDKKDETTPVNNPVAQTPTTSSKVMISEFNFKSFETKTDKTKDSGDWIELYNSDATEIDISGWELKDNNDSKSFIIPAGTKIAAQGYVVAASSTKKFKKVFPNTEVLGKIGFKLSSDGDSIRVFNAAKELVDIVTYDTSWQVLPSASGTGKTLTLSDTTKDNSKAANWIATQPTPKQP